MFITPKCDGFTGRISDCCVRQWPLDTFNKEKVPASCLDKILCERVVSFHRWELESWDRRAWDYCAGFYHYKVVVSD